MEHADVIVVGGGPAGSTCARRLVEQGRGVTLLDAAVFPRDKVCAGWITPEVMRAVDFDVAAYASGRAYQPLSAFRVGMIGSRDAVVVDYGEPVSAAIRRCEFDEWLLRRSGAVVHDGTLVRSIRRDGNDWVVNDQWSAPMLVGAGGYRCPVARMLNGPLAADIPLVVAREIEFVLDAAQEDACKVRGEAAELYFTDDVLGYGWCVRKGNVMNVGLGRLDRRLPEASVDAFARFVRRERGVPVPEARLWPGHAYVAGVPSGRQRVADGVVLIGDAAGLASDKSGEGIGPAVDSALVAAATIVEAGRDLSAARLSHYDRWLDPRRPSSGALSWIARAIPDAVTRHVARRLLTVPSFVRGVVLDRWFLHATSATRMAA